MEFYTLIKVPRKIYFIFPNVGVGGVSVLFLRLAHAIAQKNEYKCVLVDYVDGYMSKRANRGLVEVVNYSDEIEIELEDGSIALFQSMTPWSIFPRLLIPEDVHVLFWNCHPANLKVQMPFFRNSKSHSSTIQSYLMRLILLPFTYRLKKFAKYLINHDSLIFMDYENLRSTEKNIGIKIEDPIYLPIPAESKDLRDVVARESDVTINLCWIGRVVDFKYFILKRLLDDLSILASQSSMEFKVTIVGDGTHLPQLKAYCDSVDSYSLSFLAHLEEPLLNQFLVNEVDILLAMGTSALEGAKFGVPTILLDIAYSDVPETYVYRWLYQRDGSTLGETLRVFCEGGCSYESLKLLIDEVSVDEKIVSQRTHAYFLKNHSMEKVVDGLLGALDQSKCLWGDLRSAGLLGRGFIYPLFKKLKRVIKR